MDSSCLPLSASSAARSGSGAEAQGAWVRIQTPAPVPPPAPPPTWAPFLHLCFPSLDLYFPLPTGVPVCLSSLLQTKLLSFCLLWKCILPHGLIHSSCSPPGVGGQRLYAALGHKGPRRDAGGTQAAVLISEVYSWREHLTTLPSFIVTQYRLTAYCGLGFHRFFCNFNIVQLSPYLS